MDRVKHASTPEIMAARSKIANGVKFGDRRMELEGRRELQRLRMARAMRDAERLAVEAEEIEREYAEVMS